ncbi:hypothetical protein Leryth_006029 [Lithospermum erythrorhizon]|nr:hypothetical protein Leryth_006029 [Lithospermum erythrorhizon]
MKFFINNSSPRKPCIIQCFTGLMLSCFNFVVKVDPFWIQLFYFVILSLVGFVALKITASLTPKGIDVLFTSVSAVTVSSMSTLEMEVFSNTQLIFMTILMFLGGEVFVSMLGLFLASFTTKEESQTMIDAFEMDYISSNELTQKSKNMVEIRTTSIEHDKKLKLKSIKVLGYVILCYLLAVHLIGSALISIYLSLVEDAGQVLKKKGLKMLTFSLFTTVSTFTNCGFVPTNENMIIFKRNSGLLLILIPQILLGNTLYPVCLRSILWFLEKNTKKVEFNFMLQRSNEIGYSHLLPGRHSVLLATTVVGFVFIQLVLFCALEWSSEATAGLNGYQKFIGSLFEVVNSRHTGESVFDLSLLSSAILVVFIVMMYLPPYTSFLPIEDDDEVSLRREGESRNGRKSFIDYLVFSPLSYLVIFIVLICITERSKITKDQLNFNVLNIALEVFSAYGNVGFSTGYSCSKQIHADKYCKDAMYGFAGRWSDEGKIILIIVMFFGRLKKFSMRGGQAWKLL